MKKLLKALKRYERRNNMDVYLELHLDKSCSLRYFGQDIYEDFESLKDLKKFLKRD